MHLQCLVVLSGHVAIPYPFDALLVAGVCYLDQYLAMLIDHVSIDCRQVIVRTRELGSHIKPVCSQTTATSSELA